MVERLLALSPFGLITDFDGTISEIVDSPRGATISPAIRSYLSILSKRLDVVACVSGRQVEELRRMVGVSGVVYIGNHGLEWWEAECFRPVDGLSQYTEKVKVIEGELESLLAIEGIFFENKGPSLSIHYRLCLDREGVRGEVLKAIDGSTEARGFQIMEGRMVVELRPPIGVNKGSAVLELVDGYRLQGGIYIGDDITDVDAFRAIRSGSLDGLAVSVIANETPRGLGEEVDLYLNGVADVESFLGWLAHAFPAPQPEGR